MCVQIRSKDTVVPCYGCRAATDANTNAAGAAAAANSKSLEAQLAKLNKQVGCMVYC
jgi:hypothetical protein